MRRDKAVRLRAVLARRRGRRALDSDRPQLPLTPRSVTAGLPVSVRRPGAGDQPLDAAVPRPASPDDAQ